MVAMVAKVIKGFFQVAVFSKPLLSPSCTKTERQSCEATDVPKLGDTKTLQALDYRLMER